MSISVLVAALCVALLPLAASTCSKSSSSASEVTMLGGMRAGTIASERGDLRYMFLVGVYSKQEAEALGFEKLRKCAVILEASEIDGRARSIEFADQALIITSDSGVVMEAKLDPNAIYFIDVEARRAVPLQGGWSMEEFSSADGMKRLVSRVVRENIELLRKY
ncbi:MAG: hypothetical protein ACO1QR_16480 [Chthoniobacteraceae bacterium]